MIHGLANNRYLRTAALALCAAFSLAAHADENIGTTQGPLVSDILVTVQEQERLGLLQMSVGRMGCSASLLTNQWVITAAHCLDGNAMRAPNTVRFDANWGPHAQISFADYIYRSWALEDSGPLYDVALVHLRTPIRVNGSLTNHVMQMTDLTSLEMTGQNIAVYGRGINVLAYTNKAGVDIQTASDNLFRSFVFTVDKTERKSYLFPKGPGNQSMAGGDSGGPSYETSKLVPRIAGVHSWCSFTCLPGKPCGGDNKWVWVNDIQRCSDSPLGNVRDALTGLMRQVWDPARPVQTVQVSDSERQVLDDMAVDRLGDGSWDYARRAAQMFCRNRGFEFGLLDGNYQDGVRYQARCVSAVTGYWYDAGPAEMANTPHRFETIYNVPWAQAARAAADICTRRDTFNIGGLFTGFEAKTGTDGGFPDQRDGVWCFNKSNATWFDSTSAELAAQGTPIGDINATNWAAAGRAATEYCRRKAFPAGGFFNGHQLGDKRGVICLGQNSLVHDRVSEVPNYGATRAAIEAENAKKSVTLGGRALVTQSATAGRIATTGLPAPRPANAGAPASTAFYSIASNGSMARYNHNAPDSGSIPDKVPAGAGNWNTYTAVTPAGGSNVYARAANGDLLWLANDPEIGPGAWKGPVKVGNGWQSFKQLIGGGNGVIYALAADGSLVWYRHAGFASGDPNGWAGPNKVGTGWGNFRFIFSSGDGVIYAVAQDGKLLAYRHLDPVNGAMRWSGPVQVGTGWGGFAQLFSAGNGVIYGIATDGKLSYYRHLTWNAATPTFQWAGPLAVGQADPAAKIVPLLP